MSAVGAVTRAHPFVGTCIYCGSAEQLTDEHVLPYGLGGALVLKKASCKACSKVTANLEQRLLRGHWWAYRKLLGIKTRSGAYPKYRSVNLVSRTGDKSPVQVLWDDYPVVAILEFDSPSVLSNGCRPGAPFAKNAGLKLVGNGPSRALVDGSMRAILPWEKIEYPIGFDSGDLLRFIAKVAHGYAIHQYGLSACEQYFLPKLILGSGDGALSFVGGCSTELLKPKLPGAELHALVDRRVDDLLLVNLQMFRDAGEPPPIYEAVVGRIATAKVESSHTKRPDSNT